MFSITSAKSLPSVPEVCSVMASTPASGPRPKATTKIRAKTMSGTVRSNSQMRMARKRIVRDGRDVAAGEHAADQAEDGAGDGGDIGDEQGLAELQDQRRRPQYQ